VLGKIFGLEVGDFKVPKNLHKEYVLADRSIVTIARIMEATGLSYVGAYSRLQRSAQPDYIWAEMGHGGRQLQTSTKKWENEPDEVVAGIQLKASWMDGMLYTLAGPPHDRHGLVMTKKDVRSLVAYREKMRQEWRKNNNILNMEDV